MKTGPRGIRAARRAPSVRRRTPFGCATGEKRAACAPETVGQPGVVGCASSARAALGSRGQHASPNDFRLFSTSVKLTVSPGSPSERQPRPYHVADVAVEIVIVRVPAIAPEVIEDDQHVREVDLSISGVILVAWSDAAAVRANVVEVPGIRWIALAARIAVPAEFLRVGAARRRRCPQGPLSKR